MDYGTFQPIQIAATVVMNEETDYPPEVNEIYQSRRDGLIRGLERMGWHVDPPKGTMFVWALFLMLQWVRSNSASISLVERGAFARCRIWAWREGFVRFALVENEHRIRQAITSWEQVSKTLPKGD